MPEKDLRSALDALNARLDLEFGAAVDARNVLAGRRVVPSFACCGPALLHVCELWLAPDGYGRDRVLLRSGVFHSPDEAMLQAWQGLLRLAGLPDASSGEELALKMSLLPGRDVRGMLRTIAYPGLAYARRRTA